MRQASRVSRMRGMIPNTGSGRGLGRTARLEPQNPGSLSLQLASHLQSIPDIPFSYARSYTHRSRNCPRVCVIWLRDVFEWYTGGRRSSNNILARVARHMVSEVGSRVPNRWSNPIEPDPRWRPHSHPQRHSRSTATRPGRSGNASSELGIATLSPQD